MMGAMESWFANQIEAGNLITKGHLLIDVGAYKGDFTWQFLPHIDKAILFEANQQTFDGLKKTFNGHQNISIVNTAISDTEGTLSFYCNDDPATGSLLPYKHTYSPVNHTEVALTTLDQYLTHSDQPICLLKIDTQGNDLRVLQGASRTIEKYQPWIVVELIYVLLYERQSSPSEITAWLENRGYVQAAVFNQHYSNDGWLAFADGIFVPKSVIKGINEPFHLAAISEDLLKENQMLKSVCEERLELILKLNHLKGMHYLKNKILSKIFKWAGK